VCNLYSITTNQAAIINLFRVINRYVGNLAPMTGVFPDYPAPVIRNTNTGTEGGATAKDRKAMAFQRKKPRQPSASIALPRTLAAVMLIGFLAPRRTVP
jgi:putative SOS response-associated peptidase YedK